MRACGCGERSSLQCAMRGRKISSAKRVWPVTFARASTLRRGTPITRSLSPLAFRAPIGFIRESFSSGMCPPSDLFLPLLRRLRHRTVLVRDLKHRGLDGFENLKIPGTAAQVAGDCFADLIPRGVRILIQQSFRSDQNGRCAIAALRRSEVGESILQRVKISVSAEAFDSQYLLSAALEREHEAGKNWFAVEQNSAGAAFSKLTAVFCSGVTEILAQHLQQRLVGRECNIGFFAVQCKSYLRCLLRFNGQRGHDQSPRESILWPMRAFSYFAGCARQVCGARSEEHTSELQSQSNLVCR